MIIRFACLKEDSKFLIMASIVCALVILVAVISQTSNAGADTNCSYWAQCISGIH